MNKQETTSFHNLPFIKKTNPKLLIGVMLGNYVFFILVLPLFALFSLILKNSWREILEKALDPIAISAYAFTIKMALTAALLNSVFGFLITWIITRYEFRGKRFVDAAVDLPFALPTSVAGLTLATVYGHQGWVGNYLKMANIQIIYTRFGVLLAMIFVSFPFVIRSLQPVLQEFDHGLEEAAWGMGASSFQTFLRVIFPTLVPALVTGFTLSFSRALGEFGSVVMISSNLPLDDLVTSVLIYQSLEQYDYFGASVIGAVILLLALIIIFLVNTAQSFYSRR